MRGVTVSTVGGYAPVWFSDVFPLARLLPFPEGMKVETASRAAVLSPRTGTRVGWLQYLIAIHVFVASFYATLAFLNPERSTTGQALLRGYSVPAAALAAAEE